MTARTRRVNPLKLDPTRTATLRRTFATAIRRRFAKLKLALVKLVIEEDIFGLKATHVVQNAQEWRFRTSPEKVAAFLVWLREQFGSAIVSLTDEQLWRVYIEQGFRKGAARSFDDFMRLVDAAKMAERPDFYAGTREEFLRDSFRQPETVDKLQLLAARTFTDLKNVTEDMATKMGRVLADGLVQGKGAASVARELTRQLDLSRERAELVARTELIRAHAEGQLSAFEKLGVTEVGAAVEWSTAGDGRTCPLCAPLDGVVFKLSEAHGMIPRHPRCRCAWIPSGVGESPAGQKRALADVSEAVRSSIQREGKSYSGWSPATPLTADRPEPIVNADLVAFSRLVRGCQ